MGVEHKDKSEMNETPVMYFTVIMRKQVAYKTQAEFIRCV